MKAEEALSVAKTYVNQTLVGMGALKGAPCTIKSVAKSGNVNVVTFEWTDTNNVKHESTMSVADGTEVFHDVSDLPTLSSTDRALYFVEDEACFYLWDGTSWSPQQADISALTTEQVNNLISIL